MNSIKLIMPVTVKAKLTEKLRTQIVDEFTKVAEQMTLEIKQINIDMQRELERSPQHAKRKKFRLTLNNAIGAVSTRLAAFLLQKKSPRLSGKFFSVLSL